MLNLQHNIVSVLYTIKGMSESHLIQAEEGRYPDREVRLLHAEKILKKIGAQAWKALEITKRLGLALKEQQSPKDRKASVQEVWRATEAMLKKEFPNRQVEFMNRIPEDFPQIQCVPDELQEILYHLAKNALQAMRGNNARASRLILRSQVGFNTSEEPLAVITLSDTGPGMPQTVLSHLFRPFYTTKPEGEGNGLGLYLVREIVRKNGGKITVSSFEGHGTAFTLEFPLVRAEDQSALEGCRSLPDSRQAGTGKIEEVA